MFSRASIKESESYLPSLAEQKQYWDERWDRNRIPNLWQLRRAEKILEMIRSLALDRPKILDLGCGTGWFAGQLSQVGETIGIDLSETAIRVANLQFPHVRFISGNLYEIPFLPEEFDIVVAQEVIAHVEDQVKFLERVAYTLKPEGYLIVTTVNKFVIERTPQAPDPREHIKQWLSIKALKHLLASYFEVIATTTVIPMGNCGILRLVNSYKINTFLSLVVPRQRLEILKEKAGLGYTRIVMSRKR
jgi:2-polyprenyl-3-methyl-5-hydroxy-6-metoxy-1,4-benzoquinol methylase